MAGNDYVSFRICPRDEFLKIKKVKSHLKIGLVRFKNILEEIVFTCCIWDKMFA